MGIPTKPPFQIGQKVTCVRPSRGQWIVNGREYEIATSSNPTMTGTILVTVDTHPTEYFAGRFCINGLGHIDEPCILCGQRWSNIEVNE